MSLLRNFDRLIFYVFFHHQFTALIRYNFNGSVKAVRWFYAAIGQCLNSLKKICSSMGRIDNLSGVPAHKRIDVRIL